MKIIITRLLVLVFICFVNLLTAQNQDTIKLVKNPAQKSIHICKWGDDRWMVLNTNGETYIFKSGLEDGKYIAYYDKKLEKDTAMIVVIKNGEINGLLQRWDPKCHYLEEECEFKDGVMNGYRKLCFITPEGVRLVNIDLWKNNVHQKNIQMEW